MEVSLLTYRLSDFMNQIAENQMEELDNKEKIHNERLMRQNQISRMGMVSYSKNAYDRKMARMESVNNISGLKKRNKENEPCNEKEKTKQQKKMGAVWGAAKSFKNITDKDADSMYEAKTMDKPLVAPQKNKFMKVAKFAVMINQVSQGRGICTCSSLDAKCDIHDS